MGGALAPPIVRANLEVRPYTSILFPILSVNAKKGGSRPASGGAHHLRPNWAATFGVCRVPEPDRRDTVKIM